MTERNNGINLNLKIPTKNEIPGYRNHRLSGQRRSSVAGLTEDDRQTVDKERQVGDPMQLRTEVLNL